MIPNPLNPFALRCHPGKHLPAPDPDPGRLSGILQHAHVLKDPVSAAHRFTLRRARDDTPGRQQTRLSWPGLIGSSMKEAKIPIAYWMAGSSPAMTAEAVAIFSRARSWADTAGLRSNQAERGA